jgi:hypothetical protein
MTTDPATASAIKKALVGVAVVVVGVLVALSISGWFEVRSDSKARDTYLTRLAGDLAIERSFLEGTVRHAVAIQEISAQLEPFFEEGETGADPLQLLVLLNYSTNRRITGLLVPTYDDLMGTRALRLFPDPAFRADLLSTFSTLERMHSAAGFGASYRQLVRRMIPLPVHDAMIASCPTTVEWALCDLSDMPGSQEALTAIAGRSDIREAYRLHARELRTFLQDMQGALSRVAAFESTYLE